MINKKLFHIGSQAVLFFLSATLTTAAYAYGGSSAAQSSSCKTVRISEENPAPKAIIPELSNFSFVASSDVRESSIAVKIRGQEGELTITQQPNKSYLVEGHFPEPITEARYVRIDILSESVRGCSSHHHYLVQVEPEGQSEEE
ncbi:hypothetical protein [Nitrosococcus oceani]|uniref:Uncharacterized protein n=2 Tax=Nitrosococcus oceani TaxID=1229 RepID=Q3J7L9_NITOC|nr:hypothetical protein [Nitrosococcus oceani]KFI18410.1 hypothetical protein IB75_14460 [Nitrosococcus oceani C-27]ABA59177.1 hypothetical protein Noc_2724 [Nitrosococcus oceani ATCC 19707]EDZ66573.1 hypothetical protein NOC27_3253 [Nitrosococcus oceani AFC27]KFI21636.1 hypothetical protein HW44_14115 [Nitrosococcus oceani]GEM20293.1 hypothetical protein NONS58_17060 [Nitrosococcus oceani]